MPLDARRVKKALRSKLRCPEEKGGHHLFYKVEEDGQVVATTKMSHGSGGDVSDGVVGQMAKQLGTSRPLFEGLVTCTKERDHYIADLRERGVLDPLR